MNKNPNPTPRPASTTTAPATTDADLQLTTTATDLAVIEKTALEKLKKTQAKDDLDDLLLGMRRSLLLIDTSSSMRDPLRTGKRRIDALREVVRILRDDHPVPIAAFGRFPSATGTYGFETVMIVEDVPEPAGMTPLADAIRFGHREGATHLVVVTDGEPDDEHDAYAAATEFANPIDVFYVGDPNGPGARFAARLAKMTGGTSGTSDLAEPKQLQTKIAGLLGDGGL